MIGVRRFLVCAALLACGVSSARAVAQAPSETNALAAGETEAQLREARTHFKLGVDLYREGNFRAAIIEFRSAYALRNNYKLLYNLAQTSVELLEYANAMDYLTRYLNDGGDELAPAQRREVRRTISWLQSRMATLSVHSNEPGAEIYLDQTPAGTEPLGEDLRVSVGRHSVSAKKPGLSDVDSVVEVAAGEHRELRLDFAPPAREEVALPVVNKAPVFEPAAAEVARSHTFLIWSTITTAAFAAGAVTTSMLTMRSEEQYHQARQFPAVGSQLNALRQDAKTKALVTDILWAATLGSATLATIALFSGEQESPSPKQVAQLSVAASAAQLSLRGTF